VSRWPTYEQALAHISGYVKSLMRYGFAKRLCLLEQAFLIARFIRLALQPNDFTSQIIDFVSDSRIGSDAQFCSL